MTKKIEKIRNLINKLENRAVALLNEERESTRFLSDEARSALLDCYEDEEQTNVLQTTYFCVGVEDLTDKDLLEDWLIAFWECYETHDAWIDHLQHNLKAVFVINEWLQRKDEGK